MRIQNKILNCSSSTTFTIWYQSEKVSNIVRLLFYKTGGVSQCLKLFHFGISYRVVNMWFWRWMSRPSSVPNYLAISIRETMKKIRLRHVYYLNYFADTVQNGLILGVHFTSKHVSENAQNAGFAVMTPRLLGA